jgi:16S rRNA (uracil1498-N3)-methyltransferase
MTDRYYVAPIPAAGEVMLSEEETRHAQVMRCKVGDRLVLFDGQGREATARITALAKRSMICAVESVRSMDRRWSLSIGLAVALPKGDRQRVLVEKLVELGVDRLLPLRADHGVAEPVENALQRLHRYAIEACKQSGRNHLIDILPPQQATNFFAQLIGRQCDGWIADPSADSALPWTLPDRSNRSASSSHPQRRRAPDVPASTDEDLPIEPTCWLAIGPEGGWSRTEVSTAKVHGWQVVGLGPTILRTETAAVTIAAFALAIHRAQAIGSMNQDQVDEKNSIASLDADTDVQQGAKGNA